MIIETFTLAILRIPEKQYEIVVGSRLEVNCTASGYPRPSVEWLNGVNSRRTQTVHEVNSTTTITTLIIDNVSL